VRDKSKEAIKLSDISSKNYEALKGKLEIGAGNIINLTVFGSVGCMAGRASSWYKVPFPQFPEVHFWGSNPIWRYSRKLAA